MYKSRIDLLKVKQYTSLSHINRGGQTGEAIIMSQILSIKLIDCKIIWGIYALTKDAKLSFGRS